MGSSEHWDLQSYWHMNALIVVDMQNDFIQGSLEVSGADAIIPAVQRLINYAIEYKAPVIYTRDWHPAKTSHFDHWPMHCVRNSWGAEFDERVILPRGLGKNVYWVSKGTREDTDGYSGFENPYLEMILEENNCTGVIICGLATDYCVKDTAIDACKAGYTVWVPADAVRGVNLRTTEQAVLEMTLKGIQFE